jgi:predicted O-linked N-acetylglucosamine transferase (SPINDLY family)
MATPTPPHLTGIERAVLAGDIETAATGLAAALEADPADFEARYWLASALRMAGDEPGAAQALEVARNVHALTLAQSLGVDLQRCASDGAYAEQIAAAFYAQHFVAVASAIYATADQAGGTLTPQARLGHALALQHQGRVSEAISAFRAVLEGQSSPAAQQFLLYPLLLLSDPMAYADEARAWAARHAAGVAGPAITPPPLADRKLRIGYVAPSFTGTQVRQFIAPVLGAHDPDRVEVVLYPAQAEPEASWPAWIDINPIGHLDDAAAADLIRQDRIDVLADCWGHTAGSRLPVFARRPAPVQVAWINFIQTTGLGQMDYILHADADEPVDLACQFSEAIWPIGPVFNVFRPAYERLPPGDTPALASGIVTYGSFNHPCKLSDRTIKLWGRTLQATPGSQLFLKYRYYVDPVLQRTTEARLAAWGVAPDRVLFEGESRGEEYLAAFNRIDLALDTTPAPGSTTTLEALANGVPVLTLAGDPMTLQGFYARSMALAVGLPELVARSPEQFVERAVHLAADPVALNALRARVRPGFDTGPLRDEAGYARRIEAAFARMLERARMARSG